MNLNQVAKFVLNIGALLLILLPFQSCQRVKETEEPMRRIYLCTDQEIGWWEQKVPCQITGTLGHDTLHYQGVVNYRGGTSSKFYKHSYTLKLSQADTLCGLPKNKSWILNASYIDKTFMRHKLCYDLFRMMGEYNVAPQCQYALVYENNNPKGLYVVMQRLNKKVLDIDKHDSTACIFKEPRIFYVEMPVVETTDGNYHGQTFPEFAVKDASGLVMQFRDFILTASDDDFFRKISDWVDIRNVIDWHLLLLFTNNGDGVLKNFYLYKKNAQTPFRIALWDCDHSFGRDGDNELNMLQVTIDDDRNIMLNRLWKLPWYREAMAKRWTQLRDKGVVSYKTIANMVMYNERFIRPGLAENAGLWPANSKDYFDDNEFDEEVKILLKFAKLSLEAMDKRFQRNVRK